MSKRPTLIAPSILSADFSRLADECSAVLDAGADWLHIDVMDGHYVPNITIGLPVVESIRKVLPNAFLDVHLMIDNPDQFALKFVEAGANLVSFHPETCFHPHLLIQQIRNAGAQVGLAINPGTPLSILDYLLDDIDMVLVMGVNPGFGGQKFIPSTLQKIKSVRQLINHIDKPIDIQVDGGVNLSTIEAIHSAGANILVSGSAIFGSESYQETIQKMRTALHHN